MYKPGLFEETSYGNVTAEPSSSGFFPVSTGTKKPLNPRLQPH